MKHSQQTEAVAGETSNRGVGNVPVSITNNGELIVVSLRDYFAAAAIQGRIASFTDGRINYEALSVFSFAVADAMLKAREQ